MEYTYFNEFEKWMGQGVKYADVSSETIEKYKGVFKTQNDKIDIVTEIWNKHGYSSYKNGLFWMINPNELTDIGKQFPKFPKTAIAFARTNVGGIFLFDKMTIGDAIIYLNVHTGNREIVSSSFQIFFSISIAAEPFWKEDCYGKIELKVARKFNPPEYDECMTFIPALSLGGKESVAKMKKVKLKENLEFLAQLHA